MHDLATRPPRKTAQREQVVTALVASGGEIADPSGLATAKLADVIGAGTSASSLRQVLTTMERFGVIERELRGRRCYRIRPTQLAAQQYPHLCGELLSTSDVEASSTTVDVEISSETSDVEPVEHPPIGRQERVLRVLLTEGPLEDERGWVRTKLMEAMHFEGVPQHLSTTLYTMESHGLIERKLRAKLCYRLEATALAEQRYGWVRDLDASLFVGDEPPAERRALSQPCPHCGKSVRIGVRWAAHQAAEHPDVVLDLRDEPEPETVALIPSSERLIELGADVRSDPPRSAPAALLDYDALAAAVHRLWASEAVVVEQARERAESALEDVKVRLAEAIANAERMRERARAAELRSSELERATDKLRRELKEQRHRHPTNKGASPEIDSLLAVVRATPGWRYEGLNGGGHHRVVAPDGRPYVLPSTPSDKGRGLLNARADLRRAGLPV